MKQLIRPALVLFTLLSLLTGLLYPLAVTGLAQVLFPVQANGSLIEQEGKVIGSSLIGQAFSSSRYFWSRPSATGPMENNGLASSGSNLGPRNPALVDAVKARITRLIAAHPDHVGPPPADLVTASASGLDPHISPAAAHYQEERISAERKLPLERVRALIETHVEGPGLGIFGEARVNVLELNLALDAVAGN
ncbi:MAG: potassium-transporting ATPase subunit C [Gammaproteobacteria bacterium RIFOXYA12_FULL_61_12]|nr:MAG: potassium-transporting ATPase subunit C [Gammaproteobacteria bacterium RIFOXYD12_FULL_61_37]OGT89139.1 MAG: potassium-transporting ATPase subunit C [Gammaproteobacteria bacterium RIFOXYA12_FULL_61_12]